MPKSNRYFEEPGDELLDHEFPEEDDSDNDLSETLPCSQCGAEVYEDAVRCPVCGAYITHDANPWSRRLNWWIVLALLAVLAAMLALLGCSTGQAPRLDPPGPVQGDAS